MSGAEGPAEPLRFVAWDIETDTSGGFGLDPNHGPIVSIAAGEYVAVDGRLEELETFVAQVGAIATEATLLVAFDLWLRGRSAGCEIVGWNSSCFDAPFVRRRSQILGVPVDLALVLDPRIVPKYGPTPGFIGGYQFTWAGHPSIDLAYELYGPDRCERIGCAWSLKPVAEHHGIEMVVVDRERIHELADSDLAAYNLSDVRGTASLYAIAAGVAQFGVTRARRSTADVIETAIGAWLESDRTVVVVDGDGREVEVVVGDGLNTGRLTDSQVAALVADLARTVAAHLSASGPLT